MSQARLGLALSGGGFRAAFFHLGALRRLAELDLLRHVATISTVSGGSILAAHYYLHFKRRFEAQQGVLSRQDYIDVLDDVEREFIDGTKKDIRNRLLGHPWTHIRALCLGYSYGGRIAKLYTRHFYGTVTRDLFDPPENDQFAADGVPLHRAIVLPDGTGGRDIASIRKNFPSSGYPGLQKSGPTLRELNVGAGKESPNTARIPRLILNATCLNAGGPFFFMVNEVGSPRIGYFRTDEVFMLVQYKSLLSNLKANFDADAYERAAARAIELAADLEAACDDLPKTSFHQDEPFPPWTADHLRVYFAAKSGEGTIGNITSAAAQCFAHNREMQQRLLACELGALRAAKVHAWYLLDEDGWNSSPERGGYTRDRHQELFVLALRNIDPRMPKALGVNAESVSADMLRLILDFYYLRSAEMIDWSAPKTLSKLTLARAVAASANFPPLFTPYKIFDLYDTDKFDVVALTDGGVTDNQGIDALLEDGCTWIIASDAGGLIEPSPEPADARLPMMDRILNMLMDGVRDAQRKVVRSQSDRVVARIFHMTDRRGTSNMSLVEPELVARIRTDLDSFNDVEIAALQHNGYVLCDGHVDLTTSRHSPFRTASALPARARRRPPDDAKTRRILHASASRAGRFSGLYPTAAGIILLVLGLAASLFAGDTFKNVRDWWNGGDNVGAYSLAQKVGTYVEASGAGETIVELRDDIADLAAGRSITGLIVLFIAVILLTRRIRRVARQWLDGRLPTLRMLEIVKSQGLWVMGVLMRVFNIVSLVCIGAFLVSFRAKWLLGVVPLWCVAVAVFFWGVWLLGWVWRKLGEIKSPAAAPS